MRSTDNAIKNRWNSTMRRVARQEAQRKLGQLPKQKKKKCERTHAVP
jgi:hypothetical protein